MSFIEALVNVAVGFALAVTTQIVVFPLFGLSVSFAQNVGLAGVFTVLSIARGYVVRRCFVRLCVLKE